MWLNYISNWSKKAGERLSKFQRGLEPMFRQCLMQILRRIESYSRGGVSMVDLYVALIIAGRRTISQVPLRFRADVEADLQALGIIE